MLGFGAIGQFAIGEGPADGAVGILAVWSHRVARAQRLLAGQQQFLAFNPYPAISIPWFHPLSEPVRIKPWLKSSRQQFLAFYPTPSPFVASGWFEPLSEPVRQKQGLRASLQQFLAHPAQLRPTPMVTGILDSLETKDIFLGGAMVWNRATNTEIGVVNTTPQPAEIGLYQTGPTAGTITVRISIIIG